MYGAISLTKGVSLDSRSAKILAARLLNRYLELERLLGARVMKSLAVLILQFLGLTLEDSQASDATATAIEDKVNEQIELERVQTLMQIYDICWQNIRANEAQRNTFFNFYIIICGAYIALIEPLSSLPNSQDIRTSALMLGMFIILIVGLIIMSISLRCRCVIKRDLGIVKTVADYLSEGDYENGPFQAIARFYRNRNAQKFFKAIDNTFLIIAAVTVISTGMSFITIDLLDEIGSFTYCLVGGVFLLYAACFFVLRWMHYRSLA